MSQNACAVTEMVTNFDLMSAVYRAGIAKKFKLNASSFAVLIGLCNHYNNQKGVVFPSIDYLMEHLNLSKPTVLKAINALVDNRLIIKTKKGSHNIYAFTNVLFETLHIEMEKTKEITARGKNSAPARLNNFTSRGKDSLPKQDNKKQDNKKQDNNKNKVLNFSLTEFQKRYADVFEKLSEREIVKYKSLQGYDKEDYLKAKRKEHAQAHANKELQLKIENEKKNTGSPLDFDREQATEYLNNLPAFLKGSNFAVELRKKWQS